MASGSGTALLVLVLAVGATAHFFFIVSSSAFFFSTALAVAAAVNDVVPDAVVPLGFNTFKDFRLPPVAVSVLLLLAKLSVLAGVCSVGS